MRERNPCEVESPQLDGKASESMFNSMFPEDHKPLIDTRSPKAVESGLSQDEWMALNEA